MKEMTLEEIQHYSLKVLLRVHEFCIAHDIPYTLAYGTLIGAVRHKGFIPWDDDIDIIMTRENFERFLKEFQSDDHFRLVSPYDENSYIAFARVCDIKETEIETKLPWSNYTTGVWIDIFPMDSVSDNEAQYKIQWQLHHVLWKLVENMRDTMKSWAPHYYWKFLFKKMLYLNGVLARPSIKLHMSRINNPKYAASAHCAQLACCDEYGFYEKKDFEEYTTLEFEGYKLMAIKEYDKVLRLLYDDYMQLPPEESQVSKQLSYIGFYLK